MTAQTAEVAATIEVVQRPETSPIGLQFTNIDRELETPRGYVKLRFQRREAWTACDLPASGTAAACEPPEEVQELVHADLSVLVGVRQVEQLADLDVRDFAPAVHRSPARSCDPTSFCTLALKETEPDLSTVLQLRLSLSAAD